MPEKEFFDEVRQEFVKAKGEILQLEHSLVSISKWESAWCKPFLGKDGKTEEETEDYIRCMTISQNVPPEVYRDIPAGVLDQITDYINAPMTATWFNERKDAKKNREIVTAEIVYYWMIALNIPMECQKWHLNRLLTLIRVCSLKNAPPKKMGRKEMLAYRKALNESRRSQINTKG
jgi:hypothetical protein